MVSTDIKTKPCIVGGKEILTDDFITVYNPYTGGKIAQVSLAGPKEIEEAVTTATRLFKELSSTTRYERSRWCTKVADAIKNSSEELAKLIVAEAGKPIRFARAEVERAQNTFRVASYEILKFTGEVIPLDAARSGKGYTGFTDRVPRGPVLGITPFNFPLNLVAHKVAPALALGAPILLKPASATPLTALKLAELILACGIPKGFISVLPMPGSQAQQLVSDQRIKILTFTGSSEVGWQLKNNAPKKKVLLELGGNAPVIVHEDCHLPEAASRIALGGYAYAGQVCISVQRIMVHQKIYQEFCQQYLEVVQNLPLGDPSDESTVIGPMIRAEEVDRVDQWVKEACQAGGRLLTGGHAHKPFYKPTVLEGVQPESKVWSEEIFGPVTVIRQYDNFEEALRLCNQGRFGLQAGLFTNDIGRIMQGFSELEFGGIVVNDYPTFRVDLMPYGGVKDSGFGREGLAYALEEMTEPRLLIIKTASP